MKAIKIYKNYQSIHDAVKAGELKIGDKAKTSVYGGLTVEIVPPVYRGEIDALGLPIKYRIEVVKPPETKKEMNVEYINRIGFKV